MRSWLFVPGNRDRMIAKARESGADVVILDLEDSVAPASKPEARAVTADALRIAPRQAALWVRVNALETGLTTADLAAVLPAGPDGLVLPKAQSGDSVRELTRLVAEAGFPTLPILAIATESASALFGLGSYGGLQDQLAGLAWGAEDLSADLGSTTARDTSGVLTGPYLLARNLMLAGAVAAQVQPIDAVWTDFRDAEGLEAECLEARRDGFTGKMAIHPSQIAIINRCFMPSEDELAEARAVIAAFKAAPGAGVVAIEGRMFDMPHLRRAERLLARART